MRLAAWWISISAVNFVIGRADPPGRGKTAKGGRREPAARRRWGAGPMLGPAGGVGRPAAAGGGSAGRS
ncbi:hypothetical protein, partial [Micromonospora sp. DT31]|uniref:hypothetical protein n=1 Tax=Micromonospora sp. DT31 TaxID=3393434 RepID=UPI003CF24FE2